MAVPMQTNKLIYKLNYDEIDKKFDIFVIQTSKQKFDRGAYILDIPAMDRNIKGVRFEDGKCFYVLMEKNYKNKYLLRQAIDKAPDTDTISFSQRASSDTEDYIILQLLLNSLGSASHDLLRFNNITGHFYYFHPQWKKDVRRKYKGLDQIPCLEIKITPECKMKFDVVTFTSEKHKDEITFDEKKFEDYTQYVVSVNNTLRRKMPHDKKTAYIQRQLDGHKNRISFINVYKLNKFNSTKMGVVAEIVQTFNENFKGLAEIDFEYISEYFSLDYNNKKVKENEMLIKAELKSKNLCLVDGIGDNESQDLCSRIQNLLLTKYNISVPIVKDIMKDRLNWYLIHNKKYYLDGSDPYKDHDDRTLIQHITLEDFGKSDIPLTLSAIIHDLLIKSDLQERKIRLFDWSSLRFEEDMILGMATGDKKNQRYFFMNIHPNGSFDITEQKIDLLSRSIYSECIDIFQAQSSSKSDETIKGIVMDSKGNINIIKDTQWVTIPEIFKIRYELENGNTKLRNEEKRTELFYDILDIKQFIYNNEEHYFAGYMGHSIKPTLQCAVHIRKFEKYQNAPSFLTKILPLMYVTFVRNNQLTVIPFPFKYLREHINSLQKSKGS